MQYSVKDIRKDELFSEFLDARGITQKTKRKHTTGMRSYCNFCLQELVNEWEQKGIIISKHVSLMSGPSFLIEEADEEQDKGIKRKKREIRKNLIKFVNYLREKNKMTLTIDTYLTTIKAFYDDNDIDILDYPKI